MTETALTEPVLIEKADGLYLEGGGLSFHGDFSKMAKRLRPARVFEELLVKAAKVKSFEGMPVAVDATGGLGEDAILLAAAGFRVKVYERDRLIFRLLEDAVKRGTKDEKVIDAVARLEIHEGDSIEAMKNLGFVPDVVVLDPMFPEKQKTGQTNKKFQLIHGLETPCEEENELLEAAMAAKPQKIVIKRPAKGPCLAGKKPSYSIDGKTIRYDVIVL